MRALLHRFCTACCRFLPAYLDPTTGRTPHTHPLGLRDARDTAGTGPFPLKCHTVPLPAMPCLLPTCSQPACPLQLPHLQFWAPLPTCRPVGGQTTSEQEEGRLGRRRTPERGPPSSVPVSGGTFTLLFRLRAACALSSPQTASAGASYSDIRHSILRSHGYQWTSIPLYHALVCRCYT